MSGRLALVEMSRGRYGWGMKKILIGMSVAFTLGLVGLYIYAFTLPDSWVVEEERVVDEPPERVWALVGDLERWDEWSPWNPDRDSTFEATVEDGGKRLRWTAEKLGEGRLEVTRSKEEEQFEYRLWFAGRDKPTIGAITLKPVESGKTRVRWVDRGDVSGNPLLRLLVGTVRDQLEDDIERALVRLDALAGTGG